MEYKTFKMKGRLDLTKRKVLRLFRGLGKENSNASSSGPLLSAASNDMAKLFANHSFSPEIEKANALMYYRMMDRPR